MFASVKPQVLLILDARYEEFGQILKGISHYQQTHRPWMISLDDAVCSATNSDWLHTRKWDGVICRQISPTLLKDCAKLGIPLVDIDDARPQAPGIMKIRPDNKAIGHLAAEYFLDKNFKHFAFCGVSGQIWSQERRDGFGEALELAGYRSVVFEAPFSGPAPSAWDAESPALLAKWLRSLPVGTGVLACNDYCARQTLRAALEAGINVPEQVAVLGVNNDVVRCGLTQPSVSSVALNSFQLGQLAAEHLERLMGGDTAVSELRVDPAGVVTRDSTNLLATQDKAVAAALSYIRENACRRISVDDVLKYVLISRSQLEHKFRRFVGHSPQVEIRRVQIAKICELLAETDLPLKEISERAGFAHVEYMSVVFKRVIGGAPGQYRKNIQAQETVKALASA